MEDSPNSVKVLAKGLAILEALGRGGRLSAAEVAKQVQVPRPTAHRLLETLMALGYLKQHGAREGYGLALRVRALSDGCRDDDWIAEIAEPVLVRLGEDIVWPCDIATYQNANMVVRVTTHRRSPLSLERIPNGHLIPMPSTAKGRTYLAFCGEAQRRLILESLDDAVLEQAGDMAHPLLLQRELDAARGFGIRIRGVQPKTSSIPRASPCRC